MPPAWHAFCQTGMAAAGSRVIARLAVAAALPR